MTREVFGNIAGSSLSDLTNNPAFPSSPTLESIQSTFEAPTDWSENYGTRMSALLIPPATGSYTFWIASDDQSALFLSTDETPARRRLICSVAAWTAPREWTKEANQQSAPIALTSGQRYYIEALQKEGGGGDNLAVRWRLPNGTVEEPIPGRHLIAYGLSAPVITQQPTNITVIEGNAATFTVRLQRYLGATFQWFRNGAPIPQATLATYSFGPVSFSDSLSTFHCLITNAQGSTNSIVATLTVQPDVTRPTLQSVGNYGDLTVVSVVFSEAVELASAASVANYAVNNGVTVTRAALGLDARTVILTTTPMPPNATCLLTVNNVRDQARTPNTILPNSSASFTTGARPLDPAFLKPGFEPVGPASRRHGIVISEIMYHPPTRTDERNGEFIEIYNSQPWVEEIGGWRISGSVSYTFPSNTVIAARSYKVIAANPADFSAVYPAVSGVLGPFADDKSLPNDAGTVRLRNAQGAVLFEVDYRDDPPWPVAADGAGPSLILARPSFGERDVRAWDASDLTAGTPGAGDVQASHPHRGLVINEVLAHTDLPDVDSIELYNSSPLAVNLSGCVLTDNPDTNKFVIGTMTLAPGAVQVFTADELGFALSSAGETVYLRNPAGNRIIDAVRFGGQENGVPWGRFPDGAPQLRRLLAPTPGSHNAAFKPAEIVLNEIMHDPVTGESDDEYVELFNPGSQPVDLGGWRLEDAVGYTIPAGTAVGPGGYLVIAGNVARLRTSYPQLNSFNSLGDFSGNLSGGGERLALSKPDWVVGTNDLGQLETNLIHIVVDEVSWRGGGRWGIWANGGGSSLELRDVRSDSRRAPNWADSDESEKSPWVTVEATGVVDNAYADATQLHVTLLGPGEALLDNVEVIPQGGANLVANSTFESGAAGWVFQGNHNQTAWESGGGFSSARSLHLRAAGRGDTGANRVRTQLTSTPSPGAVVTLRARARWLKGNPNLLLRLRGNGLEAPGYILAARNLGTPGQANLRAGPNSGPAITDVRHWPALPPANTAVTITAWVHDPDGLAHLAVHYRLDPATNDLVVPMVHAGAGLFSASLPARPAGTTAAFFIEAIDNFITPAGARFPDDAPARECVLRWGDTTLPGSLGTYRFWLTQTNVNRWSGEELMSNNPKDITFVYGTNRVIYNAAGMFHGSPYHSPSYNSPVGNSCDYDLIFPRDERLLGETDINLFRPGNGGGDGTAQAEIHGHWFAAQFGIPFLYNRPVFVFVNGQRRDDVFLDSQQPNGDFVEQWHPDDAAGDLHKIQLGFEFGDLATGANEAGYSAVGADLSRYTTTGGAMKQARYRQTWARRAAPLDELHDYTNIFSLVELVQTNAAIGTEAYTRALTSRVDVEEWFKVHVTQHLYNNYDSFSFGGGQNAFAYKPERDTWKLYLWDTDFAFGGPADEPNLFGIGGREHGPVNTHPPFARIYWQALIEAANGMLTAARSNPILDARYNGLRAGGANVASVAGIKSFIATRRAYILSVIASNAAPFTILSNGGADFSTNRNLATLTGTAPLAVRTLLVNGTPANTVWTSVSNWLIRVPLSVGANTLALSGVDSRGTLVPGLSRAIRVTFTGIAEPPDRVVLNEIHYHPAVPDTSFVELLNTATNTTFDLSGWRLDGANYTFPEGTLVEPGQFLVVAADVTLFTESFGVLGNLVGAFPGALDNGGEILKLVIPGATPAEDVVVDSLRYDDDPPWPAMADGFGPSLQLIDPLQDNSRVGNWAAARVETNEAPQVLVTFTNVWRYHQTAAFTTTDWTSPGFNDATWLSGPGLLYVEAATLPAPKSTALVLGRITYYFRTRFVFSGNPDAHSLLLHAVIDDGAAIYLNGQEITRLRLSPGNLSYGTLASEGVGDAALEGPFLLPATALVNGTNTLAVEVHQSGSGSSDVVMGVSLETRPGSTRPLTPGAANSLRATLPPFSAVWLNEIQVQNLTGLADHAGDREPWVELHNAGSTPVDLAGWLLSDDVGQSAKWSFPVDASLAPGEFRLVWLDEEPGETIPGEWHAGFRPGPVSGTIMLSRLVNDSPQTVDFLNYLLPVPNATFGSWPDGQGIVRRNFAHATPGGPNDPAWPEFRVVINEWMADNTSTLADPADGQFEDWFELFNPGTETVDLGGCWLTDNLTNATQFRVPAGYIIPPGGRLLVWADGESGQNRSTNVDLHVSFKLGAEGDAIGLFDPAGTVIDAVSFGAQTNDIAQGRWPDGGNTIEFLATPTPRLSNGRDPVASPAILAVESLADGRVSITWATTPGRRYQVEFKSVLEEPAWTPLAASLTATDETATQVDRVQPHPQRFYRVIRVE